MLLNGNLTSSRTRREHGLSAVSVKEKALQILLRKLQSWSLFLRLGRIWWLLLLALLLIEVFIIVVSFGLLFLLRILVLSPLRCFLIRVSFWGGLFYWCCLTAFAFCFLFLRLSYGRWRLNSCFTLFDFLSFLSLCFTLMLGLINKLGCLLFAFWAGWWLGWGIVCRITLDACRSCTVLFVEYSFSLFSRFLCSLLHLFMSLQVVINVVKASLAARRQTLD